MIFAFTHKIAQGEISSTLQEVTVPILSNYECRKTGYGSSRITDNMLCAGFKDGKKDSCQVSKCCFTSQIQLLYINWACVVSFVDNDDGIFSNFFFLVDFQGDSGGPLLVKNDTIYQVVGVVSWGEGMNCSTECLTVC